MPDSSNPSLLEPLLDSWDRNNRILVDEVDGETGPRIAGSLEVDPSFPDAPDDIAVIVRRSPELYAYLRCDARLPDATVQTMIDALCERMNPDNR